MHHLKRKYQKQLTTTTTECIKLCLKAHRCCYCYLFLPCLPLVEQCMVRKGTQEANVAFSPNISRIRPGFSPTQSHKSRPSVLGGARAKVNEIFITERSLARAPPSGDGDGVLHNVEQIVLMIGKLQHNESLGTGELHRVPSVPKLLSQG